ncbi:hypothetical protein BMS3Abin16_00387 [archaeon BMS3Abin16]|nr:hypothetical protein BMS3Abin16_00387 [archaeon BMS3Abin16]
MWRDRYGNWYACAASLLILYHRPVFVEDECDIRVDCCHALHKFFDVVSGPWVVTDEIEAHPGSVFRELLFNIVFFHYLCDLAFAVVIDMAVGLFFKIGFADDFGGFSCGLV